MAEDELARANRQLDLLETQLQQQATAYDHAQWTGGGELVLIGDMGLFGAEGEDDDDDELGQVISIDGDQAQVKVVSDGKVSIRIFGECRTLVGRGRLPRIDDREWRN